ncbi:MAG: homoserine dehydrogenase [Ruminococcaceae bacterium]|nr:homoserine dehydrogenase [Oscillospiraceae bacterium]
MKIAIMGFGVVGSGVGEVVTKNQDILVKKCGEPIEIAHILDLRDFPDSEFRCFTKDFNDILNDPEVGIVVETMGGVNPAYEFSKKLLLAGKSVITSNKELVAAHGTELLQIARERNLNYLFEASVGGGIPIIRPMFSCLTAGEATDVFGILNGTTNYILTQMFQKGETFDNALRAAQKKGYAEADPTADVEGHDTCRKIAILSALAFGDSVLTERIPTEGITKITAEDVAYAEKLGYSIKLIGHATKAEDGGVFAAVFPAFVPKSNPLAGINDVFNGIIVKGEDLGDVMFYGRGAGKLPTANAVVADVVDAIKHKGVNIIIKWNEYKPENQSEGKLQKYPYYVRFSGKAVSGLEGCQIVTFDEEEYKNEFAVITKPMTETALGEFVAGVEGMGGKALGKLRLIGE